VTKFQMPIYLSFFIETTQNSTSNDVLTDSLAGAIGEPKTITKNNAALKLLKLDWHRA